MRTLTRLLIFFTVIAFVACEAEKPEGAYSDNYVQVVSRVVPFSKKDVNSRTADEGVIKNLSMFLFNTGGTLVAYQWLEGEKPVFIINRNEYSSHDMTASKLYIVANHPEYTSNPPSSINELNQVTVDAAAVIDEIPATGFPMIGSLTINLTEGVTLPSKILEIPLINLYAKMDFTLAVDIEQSASNITPQFQLDSWKVYNMPQTVCFGEPADKATVARKDKSGAALSIVDVVGTTTNSTTAKKGVVDLTSKVKGTNPIADGSKVTLTFYVPEHMLKSTAAALNYGAMEINDRQKLKPLLVGNNQTPVYVRLEGTYINHQGHRMPVTYNLYLGENNYDNFCIQRNVQYNNSVTIKGITNSHPGDNYTYDPSNATVSFDYRVNVEKEVFSLYVERETLLDSHFEIRPLDIDFEKQNTVYDDDAYVELIVLKKSGNTWVEPEAADGTNLTGANWVRFENINDISDIDDVNNTPTTHLWSQNGNRFYGKRKYFTTDLVFNTLNTPKNIRTTIKYKGNANNSKRVWIYFDENTTSTAGTRSAVIRAKFYRNNSDTEPVVYDYNFVQRNLHPVSYTDNTSVTHDYLIEYFEEYLYNFDPKDKYGNTTDGMEWGLENLQLSGVADDGTDKHEAIVVDRTSTGIKILDNWIDGYIDNLVANLQIYYDFYLPRDKEKESDGITVHNRNGYEFCSEIIKTANKAAGNNPESSYYIKDLDLSQNPKSAVEYCYNKNKRNGSGIVEEVHWYLPAIDEIEDIAMGAYSEFSVFQNKNYWSCQPAFSRHHFSYDYSNGTIKREANFYIDNIGGDSTTDGDNVGRARATKVLFKESVGGVDVYETMPSGVPVDKSTNPPTYYIYKNKVIKLDWLTRVDEEYYSLVSTFNTDPDNKKYEAGNMPRRGQINRIRCVYKRLD